MLFNSFAYFIFFSLTILVYFILDKRHRWAFLLLGSCYFYMFFIPKYMLILFFTILFDYALGIYIHKARQPFKRWLMICSIISNVGILFVFKYYHFFLDNLSQLASSFHFTCPLPVLEFVLPVGLSFHTFQAMAYIFEVYRGNQQPEKHLGYYALYVMYFPQLVAGPIERPQNILHQFKLPHQWDWSRFVYGLQFITWGLLKKVVVADRLSPLVTQYYEHAQPVYWFVAACLFSFQIYCDFSGYSDIAVGSSKILGIELMQNFNKPYRAKSIAEFWSRWHMSLSTWFRDYVYIPLGGNRTTTFKWLWNIFVVFALSGFWHGASWNFIIWGVLHAGFTIAEAFVKPKLNLRLLSLLIFNRLSTFVLVTLAWIFFRITEFGTAIRLIKSILMSINNVLVDSIKSFTISPLLSFFKEVFEQSDLRVALVCLLFLWTGDALFNLYERKLNGNQQFAFFLFAGIILLIFGVSSNDQFIYFQF
jgi:alginate O-acetyltransferase complex protein AlgI